MDKKHITYFEEIDFTSDDFFSTEILLNNETVTINLEFYDGLPQYDWIKAYEHYTERLEEYKSKIDKAIVKDLKDEETTLEYIEHHLEELDEPTIEKLIKDTDADRSVVDRLLSVLKLQKIEFRFDEDEFAVWDYSFGNDITDYLLVAYTDKNGKLIEFSIDS